MALKRISHVLTRNPKYSSNHNRALVFSDSTWAGSGAFGGAVLTDIERTWDNLRYTIAMTMSMNMFGVQNTVSDVCGTFGAWDEELCARWMQAAAFFPLVRNYYTSTFYNATSGKFEPNIPSEFYNIKNFTY